MAFISSTPLTAGTKLSGTAVCARTAPKRRASATRVMSMDAGKSENVGLGEWLYRKFMHNALWEGDEDVGYEPYFKAAMAARDEEKKKIYEQMDKEEKTK